MQHTRSVVTGAAGFIGSHLSEYLLSLGHDVVGIDSLTTYYDPGIKRANMAALLTSPRFHLVEADLVNVNLGPIIEGADYVFHQAAQAGVRASWGSSFGSYTHDNILATQFLLEALKGHKLRKFVYASSSSIYGNAELPMHESVRPEPISPYGVTKLAAEYLCDLYRVNFGVPSVSLRYFTVYGPRQRPDMGIHKFIRAILTGGPITVYGDGEQSRDFTYVEDIVRANVLAAQLPTSEAVFNIGGGARITVKALVTMLERISGRRANVTYIARQRGDAGHTESNTHRARSVLNFVPSVELAEGLYRQVTWHRQALSDQLAVAG